MNDGFLTSEGSKKQLNIFITPEGWEAGKKL